MSSNLKKSIEIKNQIKTNGYAAVVRQSEQLFCGVCKIPLKKMNNGDLFCKSCLSKYKTK